MYVQLSKNLSEGISDICFLVHLLLLIACMLFLQCNEHKRGYVFMQDMDVVSLL